MAIFWRELILQLNSLGHEIVCLAPPGDQNSENLLRSYGAKLINYPLNRKGLNPLQDLQSFLALRSIFKEEKPDLLFASTIKPVIYGLLAAKQSGVPAIFATITGLGYTFERDNAFKKFINFLSTKLYRLALAKANGVFFQNTDDRELFKKNGILSPNVPLRMAAGVGVNTGQFFPAPFPPISEKGAIKFLFIGRLLEAKGLFEYAEAGKILHKRWPNARFQILGPLEEGLGAITAQQLQSWQASSGLEYLGSTQDVRPHIAAAHVIVLPSWREGAPTAVMEGMSMGRPAVVTDVPGCREVIRNGENGFLCKAHDAQDLARAMENFLKNPTLLHTMGEKSRALACSVFDSKKVAKGIINDMRDLSPKELWSKKEAQND